MKRTGRCPKCGSKDIVADAKAIDRGHGNAQHEMSVATFQKPEALIFKMKQETTVSAWGVECGYVEFYADFPQSIKLPNGPG